MRRIVDILNSCTHNGFPVVYSQEVRRACYHEMGPKLPEVQSAVQGDPGSKVSPEASKTSAGTSEGEISSEDSTEVLGRRPSVRFAPGAEAVGTKADSRRASFASSTSSASTVEDRLNSIVDQSRAEQTPSASSRSSPGFLRSVTSPRLSRAGSVTGSGCSLGSLDSISRRSSKTNDADKLKDAAVAAEVRPLSQH